MTGRETPSVQAPVFGIDGGVGELLKTSQIIHDMFADSLLEKILDQSAVTFCAAILPKRFRVAPMLDQEDPLRCRRLRKLTLELRAAI